MMEGGRGRTNPLKMSLKTKPSLFNLKFLKNMIPVNTLCKIFVQCVGLVHAREKTEVSSKNVVAESALYIHMPED